MAGKSIYRAIAALRWGLRYQIEGDGPIAVIYECIAKVVLCSDPLTANVIAAAACCRACNHVHAPYAGWHKQQTLTMPQAYQPAGQFADWDD